MEEVQDQNFAEEVAAESVRKIYGDEGVDAARHLSKPLTLKERRRTHYGSPAATPGNVRATEIYEAVKKATEKVAKRQSGEER